MEEVYLLFYNQAKCPKRIWTFVCELNTTEDLFVALHVFITVVLVKNELIKCKKNKNIMDSKRAKATYYLL